jgi:hypothetical protein
LARAGAPPQPGPSLPGSASLREAVSTLVLHGCPALNLTDDAGAPAGVLFAADLFNRRVVDSPHD